MEETHAIKIPKTELFDSEENRFYTVNAQTIRIKHSLVSVSKWEAKYHKPFLETLDKMTWEESMDYIKCMTLTQNVDPNAYKCLKRKDFEEITDYINDPMTATTISDRGGRISREIITSEIIYHWMIAYNIPVEFQKWHLNRLIMLIRVIDAKNQPSKKMSKSEIMRRNRSLNEARRRALGTKG